MRIGIITFHRANNVGAALQAAALCQYMNQQFGNTEIIDFVPNNACLAKHNNPAQKIKRFIIHVLSKRKSTRDYKFAEFRKTEMVISTQTYYGDKEMDKAAGQYNLLISGSDQILNTTLTGRSRSYYLDFDHGKKISYASSFGRIDISDDEINLIRSELPKFTALSVREYSAAEIIKRETGVEPPLVLDPVFLIDQAQWITRCNEKKHLPEKYIFVYSMEGSPRLEHAVKTVQRQTGLPVIVVHGGGKPGGIQGTVDSACGPREFLRYIRDAELIITNSFHGTAFSLIFEKRFICVAHSSRNARLENILHLINQDEKMVFDIVDKYDKNIIVGDKCKSNLERYIDLSKAFLKQNIR